MTKLLVAHGVNLDLLGQREPDIYGHMTLKEINDAITAEADIIAKQHGISLDLDFYQSNDETEFLEAVASAAVDGAIINPAAWTHTSLALADRLASVSFPFIEVHLSNLAKREEFRQKSYSAPFASGVVYGLGLNSYIAGLYALVKILQVPSA